MKKMILALFAALTLGAASGLAVEVKDNGGAELDGARSMWAG
ncbi:hypothetical protein V3W47_06600 [Deinococcus sp. YIM 134068]